MIADPMPPRAKTDDGGDDKRQAVSARVPADYVKKMDDLAAWDERDRSDIIFFAIREYLANHYEQERAAHEKKKQQSKAR
jgi:predicted transcriptional regulator